MELKDFVSKTLQEILTGVKEAQDSVAGKHVGTVVPVTFSQDNLKQPENITPFQNVSFEIVVNVEENSGSEASISVLGGWINGKAKGNNGNSNMEATKISFSVPISFAERTRNS
ncbi:hypothetical protein [Nitrincola sp. MINF-07-Sa-05]|uniref:hypothetical protein n=1 Tax=Nitrincola salilacus TaxID=3400273 RepID=UPI0039185090